MYALRYISEICTYDRDINTMMINLYETAYIGEPGGEDRSWLRRISCTRHPRTGMPGEPNDPGLNQICMPKFRLTHPDENPEIWTLRHLDNEYALRQTQSVVLKDVTDDVRLKNLLETLVEQSAAEN